MYRFRSIQKLFDFKELENQEIYFSSPKELNDPAEGYFEIYWNGDIILWKKFFSHYIYCYYEVILLDKMGVSLSEESIPYLKAFKNINICVENFIKIESAFFNNEHVKELLKQFSEKESVSKYELTLLLTNTGTYLEDLIEKVIGSEKQVEFNGVGIDIFLNIINRKEIKDSPIYEAVYFAIYSEAKLSSNNNKFIKYFSYIYIENINKMVFDPWYVSCFVKKEEPDKELNILMWSHYGDGHKGVCLEFDEDICFTNKSIKIECVDVIYTNETLPLNFFEHIAINKYNQTRLKEVWYTDEKGNVSEYFDRFINKINVNLDEIISLRNEIVNRKTEDWLNENEKRMVIKDILNTYSIPSDRKFKYDFNSLKSITFGEKTSSLDKAKIIEIINKKCIETGREDFKFYQAFIDQKTKLMKTIQINTER